MNKAAIRQAARTHARTVLVLVVFCALFLWGLYKVGAVCPALLDVLAYRSLGI